MCPETAAPLPPGGCGEPLYLLSCIKPLDALTSSAERLQSKLVQTFPSGKRVIDYNVTAFDPTRHMKSWRTAWRTLTKKAGLPGFRLHDLRHCAITQLAENGTSDSTIMAIAGHVSCRMLERYSHVRMEAKRTAMEALAVSYQNGGL